MSDKYENFQGAARGAVAELALSMQDDLLDELRKPRHLGDIDTDVKCGDLLKVTYIKLLENVRDKIQDELDRIEDDS